MKRNEKFYQGKKYRKIIEQDNNRWKKKKSKRLTFCGYKRRLYLNKAAKKLIEFEYLSEFINIIAIYEYSQYPDEWTWSINDIYHVLKSFDVEEFVKLPAKFQMLLIKKSPSIDDINSNYPHIHNLNDYSLNPNYYKYLYFKVKENECLMIGDSLRSDITGAVSVGMHAAWINRPGKSYDLAKITPEFELNTLKDIDRVLGVLNGKKK
jgi:FMN phosphatase YigB (HAD superfamily)